MRYFIISILFSGLYFSVSHAQNLNHYQLISSDPHVVKSIQPYVQTRFKGGRLWLVSLKAPSNTPSWVYNYLQQTDLTKVNHYTPSMNDLRRILLPPIDDSYLKMISMERIQAGVPTLLTIEFWDTKSPCYHAECDKYNTINFPYATEITKLNTAAVLTADIGFVRIR